MDENYTSGLVKSQAEEIKKQDKKRDRENTKWRLLQRSTTKFWRASDETLEE
jgi:hypothetical protein